MTSYYLGMKYKLVYHYSCIHNFVVDVHPGNIHRSHVQSQDNTSVKMSGRCIAQIAKMSIDPKFVELTAGVLVIYIFF